VNKLEDIRKIVKKAEKDFIKAKLVYCKEGVYVKETKKQHDKRLEKNFHTYAEALEEIYEIVNK